MAPPADEHSPAPGELQELIRRADGHREVLAGRIVAQCLERLPHYRGIPDSLLAEVRASVLYHLAMLYRVTLATGRRLTDEDLEASLQTARVRASQGMPLGEFLTFFLVGLTMSWDDLMATVGDDPELRSQLLGRVTAVIANQTHLMTAITEAYVEERERLSRFRELDLDDFFQLLSSDLAMDHAVEVRAKVLGIPLDAPRVVAVFERGSVPESEEGASVAARDLQRELSQRIAGDEVWVGRAPRGFLALIPEDAEAEGLAQIAEALFGGESRVGLGGSGRDVMGLRRSAREALRALEIGESLWQARRVYDYDRLAILDLVRIGTPDAEAFVQRVLGPLATGESRETSLETLRQLAAHGYRVKLAAAALGIHPHTLSYRMKQIRRRFGIDLDDPDVRLHVHVALLILDAQGHRTVA